MDFNDKELAVLKLMFENFESLFTITECIEVNSQNFYKEDLIKLAKKLNVDF